MIKLVVFDLDGVLVDTKDLHYDALNDAIFNVTGNPLMKITREEHVDRYDGLPTMKKLAMLSTEKGLDVSLFEWINNQKQMLTFDLIRDKIKPNGNIVECLRGLKEQGYKVYVASNSIRETIKLLLIYSGLIEYVDKYFSNEDVKVSKPSPEMYLRCMVDAGVSPSETLVVEDSPRGIEAANRSSASVMVVRDLHDVTLDRVMSNIGKKRCDNCDMMLKLDNLNVLIPMAGEGSRFKNAGYTFPKPLISIGNKPMIQVVVDSLNIKANYIYIVRKEHYERFNLGCMLELITPGCKVVTVDSLTEGAACTTLLAREHIDNDCPLLIANSDQYIEWDPVDFYYKMVEGKADGGILTFKSTHPKWSFVKLDDAGKVTELAEKKVISDTATVGIYWYNKGSEYVRYADKMILDNKRVNNEFYVAPVYNEYINEGKKILTHDVKEMWGIGTPEDLNVFLKNNKYQ